MKSDIIKDEKSLGNQTELTEIFAVPNIIEKTECVKEKNSCKEFLYLILGIIITLTGFSTFLNFFVIYEEEKIYITIIKRISNSSLFKNDYMINGNYLDKYDNDNNKGNNSKNSYMLEPLI